MLIVFSLKELQSCVVVHACIPNTEEANASISYIDSISEILFQKEQGEERRLEYYTCE